MSGGMGGLLGGMGPSLSPMSMMPKPQVPTLGQAVGSVMNMPASKLMNAIKPMQSPGMGGAGSPFAQMPPSRPQGIGNPTPMPPIRPPTPFPPSRPTGIGGAPLPPQRPQGIGAGNQFPGGYSKQQMDVANQFRLGLQQSGFNPIATSGIMGNAPQESSFNPSASRGSSYGLLQESGPRRSNLFASSGTRSPSPMQQAQFAAKEAKGIPYQRGNLFDAMNKASSPEDAAALWSNRFERPKAATANNQNRMVQARKFFESSGAKTPSSMRNISGQAGDIPGMGAGTRGDSGGLSQIYYGPGNKPVTVNSQRQDQFQDFLQDLPDKGYTPRDVQGYNYRNIRGGNRLSEHASGNAIDIDPTRNSFNPGNRGPMSNALPGDVGEMAKNYGLNWGGDWRNKKDFMHFQGDPLSRVDVAGGNKRPGMEAGTATSTQLDKRIASTEKQLSDMDAQEKNPSVLKRIGRAAKQFGESMSGGQGGGQGQDQGKDQKQDQKQAPQGQDQGQQMIAGQAGQAGQAAAEQTRQMASQFYERSSHLLDAPQIQSQDQLSGLKPGQAFRGPDGKLRFYMPQRAQPQSRRPMDSEAG